MKSSWIAALAAVGAGVGSFLLLRPRGAAAAAPPSTPPGPPPTVVHPHAAPRYAAAAPTYASAVAPSTAALPPGAIGIPSSNDLSGSAFVQSLQGTSEYGRERMIYDAVLAGHLPSAFRSFIPVTVSDGQHTVTFYAAPAYLGVGNDADYFHAPMTAVTGQKIASALGMFLPTKAMVLAIHQSPATVHLPFRAHGDPRDALATFVEANSEIEGARAGRWGLLDDYSKNYFVGNALRRNPGKIAIIGGWRADGTQVQPAAAPHSLGYRDYSQRVRLIAPTVVVDGAQVRLVDALRGGPAVALLGDGESTPESALRYPVA